MKLPQPRQDGARILTPESRAKMGANKGKKMSESTRKLLQARTRTKGSSNLLRWAWMVGACENLGLTLERVLDYWKIREGDTIIRVFRNVKDAMNYLELEAGVNGIALPDRPAEIQKSPRKYLKAEHPEKDTNIFVRQSTRIAIKSAANAVGLTMIDYLAKMFEAEKTGDIDENIE